MTPLQIIAEFERGCSIGDTPYECPQCVEQMLSILKQKLRDNYTEMANAIMNLPTDVEHLPTHDRVLYKMGHRDARHNAVEVIYTYGEE